LKLLDELKEDVAYAIVSIRTEKERKRAEEALRESQEQFRIAQDMSPDGFTILRPVRDAQERVVDFTWIYENAAVARLNGTDPEAVVGRRLLELFPGHRGTPFLRAYQQVAESGETCIFEADYSGESMPKPTSFRIVVVPMAGDIAILAQDLTERKRAEEALRLQSASLEAAANAIVITDCDGVIEWVNPAFVTLTGYTLEESVGRNPRELVKSGKQDQQFYKDLWEKILAGETWRGQIINRRKNGTLYTEEQTITPLLDADGKVSHFIAIKENITERKRMEETIRESESRFRALFETSADGILIADLETKIFKYANPSICRMLGYTENELRTMNVAGIHPKDALQSVMAEFEAQARGEKALAESLPCIRKDGTIFYADVNAGKIITNDKAYNAGFFRDITERKKTENDLRLSEEHFRSVWDKSADGMRLTDREGRLIDVNAAFCKLVRMPREELLGKVLSVAYQREGPDDDLSLYQRRFDARETVSNLFGSATLWNGESVDLDISSSFIETGGQERLLLSLFRDVTEKRKSEKRLEGERNLLRTIIDAIPDEITVKDTERRFVVVNSGTVNALKRASADEIIGKKDEDLVPEHLVKDWSEEENTVLAGGGRTRDRVANKIDPETGEIERSLLVSKIPLKDHEGKIIGLVGINRDITALKQAEELLEKERTLLLTLIENIPDEVCLKDLRHRYLVANSASLKALGVKSLSALIGKTDLDLVGPDLAQEHLAEEDAILQSGEPLINRERIKRDPKTGEIERCLLTTKAPVKDQDGKTIGILVVNRYITERKRMEESLRASEEKFRALFEESIDAVYISSVDGKLVDINRAGIELFGYGSKENYLEMDLISSYVEPGEKERFDRQMEKEGFVKDFELVFRRADGKKLTVLETATAVRDKQGKIVQYRGIIRDVTGQRLLESQFVQAQKMESIGTLAGGIAHDFNNILGIILGHLALLERTRHDEAQFDESIFSINKAVDRGASLVRQILTFARKTEAELEPVNINAATKELAKMLEGTFPKTIAVTLQLDRTIPVVSLDPTQLHQALLNLCVNARDAMEGTGTLAIATRLVPGRDVSSRFPKASANHYVQVSVSDTGCGMDEETKQRIFEPFFTTKAEGKGTGLGLAVVYGVLLAHNGFIDVDTAPGHGTAFHLFFPVPEGILTTSEKETGTQEDLPCGTETILVVEDEDVLRDLLTKILEMQGYTVISASDGEEAVRRFGEHADEIDLVLSDMGLPKRGGWDAFRMMQRVDSSVRALLASGYIEPGQKSEILKSGVKRFIHKPYQVSEVLKAVRETLDEKK
jgi:PAS domain S-box-containing protein